MPLRGGKDLEPSSKICFFLVLAIVWLWNSKGAMGTYDYRGDGTHSSTDLSSMDGKI